MRWCRGSFSRARPWALPALALWLAAACGRQPLDEADVTGAAGGSAGGRGAAAGGGGSDAAAGGGGTCAAGAAGAGGPGGRLGTQCTDGIDNDADGKIDYDDPECVGGYDNDEATFAWGVPGFNTDACKTDCFFDGNSGSGDDNCLWQLKCDPASTAPNCPYDAAYSAAHAAECSLSSSQTQVCVDRCSKLVPDGCDCFGCCSVPGLAKPVRLAATCTAADFANPAKCPPCTQVTQCLNPCERCEICIGKPALPDDCATPNGCPPYACPAGAIACGAYGVAPSLCPAGTSCVTGCCRRLDALP